MYRGTGLIESTEALVTGVDTLQKSRKVPGIVTQAYITHRISVRVYIRCTCTLGILARGVQNVQKFPVLVYMSYRTSRRSGYGYESVTELTEVSGSVSRAYRAHRRSVQV